MCSTASDVVIIVPQTRGRLVNDVYYITSPGKNVKTIVTAMGVFEKIGDDDKFTLTGYFESETDDREKII